jgi:hypothetical protein
MISMLVASIAYKYPLDHVKAISSGDVKAYVIILACSGSRPLSYRNKSVMFFSPTRTRLESYLFFHRLLHVISVTGQG